MPKIKIQVDNYTERQRLIGILAELGYKTWVEEQKRIFDSSIYFVLAELPANCVIWDNVYDKEPITVLMGAKNETK